MVSNGHQRNSVEALHMPTVAMTKNPKLLKLLNQKTLLMICVGVVVFLLIIIIIVIIAIKK